MDAHRQKIAEIAAVPTPEIGNVFAGFISHARDKGRLSNDWDAAWDSWCRTNTEHRKKSQPQRPAVNPRYRV
ncbi:hypothetical protein [Methylobacterium brachythecii]|uniref:Uncharacterized protein n=1 Tax=Methylobacterium brachythecii TaxID=1176177 RepID=A0A7W6F5X5_9HYPH|nr:hypothetical protein [Methylobacterium brachythecii]MBB3901356.1 hypothetical protein [Methylobacterium brachythecii]